MPQMPGAKAKCNLPNTHVCTLLDTTNIYFFPTEQLFRSACPSFWKYMVLNLKLPSYRCNCKKKNTMSNHYIVRKMTK